MERYEKRALDKVMVILRETLDPAVVMPHLIAENIMTLRDSEEIEANESRAAKVQMFVSVLQTRGNKAFQAFVNALDSGLNKELASSLRNQARTLKMLETDPPLQYSSTMEKSLSVEESTGEHTEVQTSDKLNEKNKEEKVVSTDEEDKELNTQDPLLQNSSTMEKSLSVEESTGEQSEVQTSDKLNETNKEDKVVSTDEEDKELNTEVLPLPNSSKKPQHDEQSGIYTDNKGTDVDLLTKRTQLFREFLCQLGLETNLTDKYSVFGSQTLKATTLFDPEKKDIFDVFIAKITSYDYRVQKIRYSQEQGHATSASSISSDNESDEEDWFGNFEGKQKSSDASNTFSSRDIVFAILNCLDPFLLQEILMKLSACQLAIPLLMPNLNGNSVTLNVWGLRKISKSWYDSREDTIQTENIVSHPFPAVAALRMGKIPISKSNVLNKVLGPTQGNDEHAYFLSKEQDPHSAYWSKGTLECVWFLPKQDVDAANITTAFALLNIRGDALKFQTQVKYAVLNACVTVIFVDFENINKRRSAIDEIKTQSHVILIVSGHEGSRQKIRAKSFITIIYAEGYNALEVSEFISIYLKKYFEKTEKSKTFCVESTVEHCKSLTIEVDELNKKCQVAKEASQNICGLISQTSPKCHIFVLQKYWQQWAELDKDKNSVSGNIEKVIQENKNQKRKVRERQASVTPSQAVCKFYAACILDKEISQFFLGYLEFYLNAISNTTFKPLLKELHNYSLERRKISTKIQKNTKLRRMDDVESDEEVLKDIQKLKNKEKGIIEEERKCIQKIDESTFGVEYFVREIGQIDECHLSVQHGKAQLSMDINNLPTIAVNLLLNGYPVEIMDGEVKHVPLRWVQEILKVLSNQCGQDAKVYVVSVLGIQSSGKSTLLNSMFGVRFGVRAGRCTKGAFLQLVPVDKILKSHIGCDYLAIVDTEGLGAPELSLQSSPEYDNELATFALCISDLTLINIGGQTMGEEMSNILQIAAHAFIRMKEVNLKAECRIVQQFVADVTAKERNEAAMQSILLKLDAAISVAAKEEGKDHLYRQFSDVFSVQNYENNASKVQYIPSLWRGFMSAPDYQYSTRVQQLKKTLLQSIKLRPNKLTIKDFSQRIADVWDAIKKENFVFSFQNTKEITLYEDLMTLYRTWTSPIRVQIMEKELQARQKIEKSTTDSIHDIQNRSVRDMEKILEDECEKVKEKLTSHLKTEKYSEISRYGFAFHSDLNSFKTQMISNVSMEIAHFAALCTKTRYKDPEKEALLADLHEKVANFAGEIRKQINEKMNYNKAVAWFEVDTFITRQFNEFWESGMKETEIKYPLKDLKQISTEIEAKVEQCIRDEVQNNALSGNVVIFLENHIRNKFSISSSIVGSLFDIQKAKGMFNTVNDVARMEFDGLIEKIKKYADDNENFNKNVQQLLADCSTFINKYRAMFDETTTVACFFMSLFIRLSQDKQVKTEMSLIAKKDISTILINKERIICLEEHLQNTLKQLIVSNAKLHVHVDKLKEEEQNLREMLDTEDEISQNQPDQNKERVRAFFSGLKKAYDKFKASNWFNKHEEWLDSTTTLTEEKFQGQTCLTEALQYYCEEMVTHCYKNVPHEHVHEAIKLGYHWGIEKFTEFGEDILSKHIDSDEYVIKFANPVEFPRMQDKIAFILGLHEKPLPEIDYMKSELTEELVQKYGFSTFPFHVVQNLDRKFVRILPLRKEKLLRSVHEIVNNIKKTFLLDEVYKPPFNTVTVSKVLSDIINKRDRELFPNEVMGPTLVHICAWVIPICAVAQYEFEKSQNPAVMLRNQRDFFLSQFKSLCSERYDKIIAKTFFDVIVKTARDSWKYKMYPELARGFIVQSSIFTVKRSFIGTVLVDICKRDSYQDIVDFLKDFAGFSQQWILKYVVENCNRTDNSLIRTILKKCIQDIKFAALCSVSKADGTLNGDSDPSLSEWINVFCKTMLEQISITCDETEMNKLKSYLKVSNIKVFSEECKKLIQSLDEMLECTIILPTPGNGEETKEWLMNALPKQIHLDLFETFKGCSEQCPFCGAVCEETLEVHAKHKVNLHFPEGIKGWRRALARTLVTEMCTSAVESDLRYKTPSWVKDPEYRPYKKYAVDYPQWYIQVIRDDKPTEYWQYIFAKYNEKFAARHECKKADIPIEWTKIDIDVALECVKTAYQLS